jgi:Peptidase S24-like
MERAFDRLDSPGPPAIIQIPYIQWVSGCFRAPVALLPKKALICSAQRTMRTHCLPRLNDEVTVKRFKRRGRDIVLLSENAKFAPIVVDPKTTAFAIEGIAVGLLRSGKKW